MGGPGCPRGGANPKGGDRGMGTTPEEGGTNLLFRIFFGRNCIKVKKIGLRPNIFHTPRSANDLLSVHSDEK